MGKIFRILFNCLLILIILVLVAYFTLRAVNKIRIYNVETGSMEDKIHPGDYILLLQKDSYKIGDVVTYTVDDYFITHRIIKIEDGKITTKGDANNLEDKDINESQIVGKVILCGGILNYVINFKFVIAAILIALYLLSCYFGKEEKDKIEEKVTDDVLIEDIDDEKEEIEELIIDEEKKDDKPKENIVEEVVIEEIKEETKEEIPNIKEEIPKKKKTNTKKTTVKKTVNKTKKTTSKTKKTTVKKKTTKKRTTGNSTKTTSKKITNIVRTNNKKPKNK